MFINIFQRNSLFSDEEDQVLDNDDIVVKNIFDSTSLKIQNNITGDVRVLTKKEENERRRSVPRLVTKEGKRKVKTMTVFKSKRKKLEDVFTTIVDYSWSGLLLFIIVIYTGSWLLFALVWHLLVFLHDKFGRMASKIMSTTFY